jgi:hypothetical protein
VEVLMDKPAGNDGDTANTRVPEIPVVVYAVVAEIAVPTVAETVWAAGVMVVFADTVALPIGIATEAQTTANIVMRRFIGGYLLVFTNRKAARYSSGGNRPQHRGLVTHLLQTAKPTE